MPQNLLIIITLSNSILLTLILFWIFNKNCAGCQAEMASWKRIILARPCPQCEKKESKKVEI